MFPLVGTPCQPACAVHRSASPRRFSCHKQLSLCSRRTGSVDSPHRPAQAERVLQGSDLHSRFLQEPLTRRAKLRDAVTVTGNASAHSRQPHHVRRSVFLAEPPRLAAWKVEGRMACAARRRTRPLVTVDLGEAYTVRGEQHAERAVWHALQAASSVCMSRARTIPSVRCVTQNRARSPGSPYAAVTSQASQLWWTTLICTKQACFGATEAYLRLGPAE